MLCFFLSGKCLHLQRQRLLHIREREHVSSCCCCILTHTHLGHKGMRKHSTHFHPCSPHTHTVEAESIWKRLRAEVIAGLCFSHPGILCSFFRFHGHWYKASRPRTEPPTPSTITMQQQQQYGTGWLNVYLRKPGDGFWTAIYALMKGFKLNW